MSTTTDQMKFLSLDELEITLANARSKNQAIGFVPTMGALHNGHLSIIERASKENDSTVVSIFVNPTQFNNAEDLANYPRNLQKDLSLLHHIKNIFVFQPRVDEVYSPRIPFTPMNLGQLAMLMEGKFRLGHFDGVVHVVHNMFRLIRPTKAYFGMKDFQQLTIIRAMVKHYQFPIEIIACETTRNSMGLALSSRNKRLSEKGLKEALIIYETLEFIREKKHVFSIQEIQKQARVFFAKGNLELEYLEIMNESSLLPASSWDEPLVCFIAAYCEGVRLIDNSLV